MAPRSSLLRSGLHRWRHGWVMISRGHPAEADGAAVKELIPAKLLPRERNQSAFDVVRLSNDAVGGLNQQGTSRTSRTAYASCARGVPRALHQMDMKFKMTDFDGGFKMRLTGEHLDGQCQPRLRL